MVNTTLPQIIDLLEANNGEIHGTCEFLELINASPSGIYENLALARKKNLIVTHPGSGRGNKAIHVLTITGWGWKALP